MRHPFQFRLRTLFWLTALAAVGSLAVPLVLRFVRPTIDNLGPWREVVALVPMLIAPLTVFAGMRRFSPPLVFVWFAAVGVILIDCRFGPCYLYMYGLAPTLLVGSLVICLRSMRGGVSVAPVLAASLCVFACLGWVVLLSSH